MQYIDHHIHIASRTTDDIERMAQTGCVCVGEPAFWMGFDRSHKTGFYDYFNQLTQWEPSRVAKYGMSHYCWIGINAKEAEDVGFSKEVIAMMPEFLDKPHVLGVGEIGLNKNTKNEMATLELLIDLANERGEQMLFHTPHLEDKYLGTEMILESLENDKRTNPERVCVDHCEEHTIRMVRDAGYWSGLTLYPTTKMTPKRAADMVEIYGPEKLLVSSSADWGPSDPLAMPKFIVEMRLRGHADSLIKQIVYDNPLALWKQSKHFDGI